ncbi:MAG: PLP-dependent aminotransferase family protein, partial [Caulobacteraceae bacterium]|nr:PLP-dependent aminotransferase family protein [Caulobacteraceae bacterium]
SGAAKALSPGLRLGFLAAPDQSAADAVARALRAHVFSPPVWGAAIFQHWVEGGEAVVIANEVRAVAHRRLALALDLFGNHAERPAEPSSLHLWLPMSEIDAERTNSRALRSGVEVTPPTAPIVDPALLSGLRLCLGQAPEAAFEAALRAVRDALPGAPDPALQRVI